MIVTLHMQRSKVQNESPWVKVKVFAGWVSSEIFCCLFQLSKIVYISWLMGSSFILKTSGILFSSLALSGSLLHLWSHLPLLWRLKWDNLRVRTSNRPNGVVFTLKQWVIKPWKDMIKLKCTLLFENAQLKRLYILWFQLYSILEKMNLWKW